MLKKIIAIFLSLSFFTSTVILHSILQSPKSVTAASLPTYFSWQSLSGSYVLIPYSLMYYDNNVETPYGHVVTLRGGIGRVSQDEPYGNYSVSFVSNASSGYTISRLMINSGIHITDGTGTLTDPYVVYGL